MKKYFEFSGTINGLNYFLRNIVLGILGYGVGYGIGYMFGIGNNVWVWCLYLCSHLYCGYN